MTDVLVFAGFFAFVGIFITVAIRSEKKRKAKLLAAIQAADFRLLHSPDKPDKAVAEALFGRVGLMRGLRTGGVGVCFAADKSINGREVLVLEHTYTSGSGDNKSSVRHVLAAVEAPVGWPEMTLTPEGPLRRLAEFAGHKDIQLEDAAFNARWRIKGSDEEFATVLLSPEIQAWLAAWPKDYWLAVGHGAVVVAARGYLTAAKLPEMIRLITELMAMIPPEMEMWDSANARTV